MGRSAGEAFARIEEELVAERAAALRRLADRLELIAQLLELRRAAPATEADHAALVDEYRLVRRQARRYRWYLEIQREAIGLRRHERLDELYGIPGE